MLNDRILITGATGTIGTYIVKELDKQKRRKLILLGRDLNKLNALKVQLQSRCAVYQIDLENPSSIFLCLNSLKEEVDTIIFSHGILKQSNFLESDDSNIEMQVNYFATQQITRYFCKLWATSNKPRYINIISSLAANVPSPSMSLYSASKAALTAWAKSLALELNNDIHIKQFIVGLVKDTNMTKNIELFRGVPSYNPSYVSKEIARLIKDKSNNYYSLGLLINVVDRFSNMSPALLNVVSRLSSPPLEERGSGR